MCNDDRLKQVRSRFARKNDKRLGLDEEINGFLFWQAYYHRESFRDNMARARGGGGGGAY